MSYIEFNMTFVKMKNFSQVVPVNSIFRATDL